MGIDKCLDVVMCAAVAVVENGIINISEWVALGYFRLRNSDGDDDNNNGTNVKK